MPKRKPPGKARAGKPDPLREITFVTDDYYLRVPGILDPADETILAHIRSTARKARVLNTRAFAGLPETLAELPETLADFATIETPSIYLSASHGTANGIANHTPTSLLDRGLQLAHHTIRICAIVEAILTLERAREVRTLRCDLGHTWRAVARTCYEAWGGQFQEWGAVTQPECEDPQTFGQVLCEYSARLLQEDPHTMPWNDI